MSETDGRRTAHRAMIVIGLVLATLLSLALLWITRRVLGWLVLAAFFATALKPLVDRLERRLVRRRALATLLVFVATFTVFTALAAVIVVPLLDEITHAVDRAPTLLAQAREGQGPVGAVLDRLNLSRYVATHSGQIDQYADQLRRPALDLLRGAAETVIAMISVTVLAYLMVLEAPRLIRCTLDLVGPGPGERLRRVGRAVSRTVTGYLTGNLLISVICGGLTFVVLVLMGVPFAAVIALLVAIADLIPLVGATLGALIAAGAGFVHSPTAGIVVLVFFVVYQQVENHLLQPVIMSRAVRLNPLTVLVSVFLAADLAGVLGALLAIPAAGIVQILLREFAPARPWLRSGRTGKPVGRSGRTGKPASGPVGDDSAATGGHLG
ncbi:MULTISPECIES: AI-2E family transporter [Micromonospora]|uniref:Predicted PurR-regulated permease PerM n=1 Tax=Micromonospora yangpuensis TaxID=683228 RepID=A0A1C6USZ8_9ACTN|nr:AI-2E family transporter [Micromonospora yangpuensis]GGM28930.1 hypothetical protein GCM10012279_54520 [Micromonospora yangpuensis]SCL57217.1 Predicted PurR-regulated permease PerM [Micromonospora yangpuensis]